MKLPHLMEQAWGPVVCSHSSAAAGAPVKPCLNFLDFPAGSEGKESACNARDLSSIPGLRKSPGGGNGNPLQYSCLGNSMDRGAWWATTVHGITNSQTQLSN